MLVSGRILPPPHHGFQFRVRFVKPIAVALALATGLSCAHAEPGYYVVNAYPDAGLRTVALRYWTLKPEGQSETVWPEIGISYGVTQRWTTGIFASLEGPSITRTHLGSWNWTNDLLLTQGDWPLDLALHTQLIRSPGEGSAIEFGPVTQTDLGRTQLTFNLFWDHAFNASEPRPTELKYQVQLRYRWQPGLHLGLQGFGELGPWAEWLAASQQSHRAGPALFGQMELEQGRHLNWQAAWLIGKAEGQRGHMFTAQAALGF
jgi:hypothetical protein